MRAREQKLRRIVRRYVLGQITEEVFLKRLDGYEYTKAILKDYIIQSVRAAKVKREKEYGHCGIEDWAARADSHRV